MDVFNEYWDSTKCINESINKFNEFLSSKAILNFVYLNEIFNKKICI